MKTSPARTPALLLALVLGLVLGWAGVARGAVHRYALIVGANRGYADEAVLRFAESDALALADTLRLVGEFRAEDMTLLRAPTAVELRQSLTSLLVRIRRGADAGDESVLLVYYSGHGDASDLHLGREAVPMAELKQLVESASAKFRLLVIDACRSGALTGVKGAVPVGGFRVDLDDELKSRGTAIITSATAAELALEAEGWGGSIFTRTFISGLRGGADESGDGAITLHEAYAYAYEETLRETRRTVTGPQHPTFEYDLTGKGSLVLSRPGRRAEDRERLGMVELVAPGRYYLLNASSGALAYEIAFDRGRRKVLVDPGRYAIEMRATDHLLVGEVRADAGEARTIAPDDLRRVAYAEAVRRGGTERRLALEPEVGAFLRPALVDGVGATRGAHVGLLFHLPLTSLRLSLQAGESAPVGPLRSRVQDLGLRLGAFHAFDLGRLSVGMGLDAGGLLFRQSFTTETRTAPPNWSLAFAAGPGFTVATRLAGPLGVALSGGYDLVLLRHRDAGRTTVVPLGVPRVALALGWQLSL